MTPERLATTPVPIGTAMEGGYLAGYTIEDGQRYAVIVAPKAEGEARNLEWNTDWRSATPGTLSVNDGFANSEAMNDDGHPAARWCRSLAIGGHSDWYLPSRDELELLYRNLKPTEDENWTYRSRAEIWDAGKYNGVDDNGNGHNASSVSPGEAYTESAPTQTTIEAFRQGGAEAFEPTWYWSSTEFGSAFAWVQHFGVSSQYGDGKHFVLRVRAVRKVTLNGEWQCQEKTFAAMKDFY